MEFMGIMVLPFIIAVSLITIFCLIFVKKEELDVPEEKIILPKAKTIIYLILFALLISVETVKSKKCHIALSYPGIL